MVFNKSFREGSEEVQVLLHSVFARFMGTGGRTQAGDLDQPMEKIVN